MGAVVIGMDVGQKVDPTAIAVVEGEHRPRAAGRPPGTDDYHLVRHLERLPLGTSYPAVATRLVAIVAGLRDRRVTPRVYVDATGVGQPVVDLLGQAGVRVTAVYFTHGDRRTVVQDGGGYVSLGKAWLVSRLQALLQTGRLLLPQTPEAQALAQELLDYEIHIDEDANDTYGAFKVGTHDDMVTAVGLAVQTAPGRPFTGASAGGNSGSSAVARYAATVPGYVGTVDPYAGPPRPRSGLS